MSDHERSLFVLNELSDLGVDLAVDDFGTGYSSLAHLRRLPITEIKIDKSFVSTMVVNDQDAAIVRSIIGLADALGLRTVAEGIETRDTWDQLDDLGCKYAQGFLISRPLPIDMFDQWLMQQNVKRLSNPVVQFPGAREIARRGG